MANLIEQRVETARNGQNPFVICEMKSGWSLDVIAAGDAVLASTDAYRINYERLGNAAPALHTHILPRYREEPEEKRRRPAWVGYDWPTSRKFEPVKDGPFIERMRRHLKGVSA